MRKSYPYYRHSRTGADVCKRESVLRETFWRLRMTQDILLVVRNTMEHDDLVALLAGLDTSELGALVAKAKEQKAADEKTLAESRAARLAELNEKRDLLTGKRAILESGRDADLDKVRARWALKIDPVDVELDAINSEIHTLAPPAPVKGAPKKRTTSNTTWELSLDGTNFSGMATFMFENGIELKKWGPRDSMQWAKAQGKHIWIKIPKNVQESTVNALSQGHVTLVW